MADYPLTPLEQLPLTIDHDAIESAYLPFLLDGREGQRAWKSDYARRRRRALLRWLGSYPRAAGVNEVTADFATADVYAQADEQVRNWQRGG